MAELKQVEEALPKPKRRNANYLMHSRNFSKKEMSKLAKRCT